MLYNSAYFRVSVTNKCNFSCYFCHREGYRGEDNSELLPEEIQFACGQARKAGFRKFKITGGEPTEREDLCSIIALLAQMELPDLSMITNGTNLTSMSQCLWDAGLRRINVTVNTLKQERLRRLNPQNQVSVASIKEGIETALQVGFHNMKINFVYYDEDSREDLEALIEFIKGNGLTLVVLPVIGGKSYYSLEDLYHIIGSYGIASEEVIVDKEGLRKRRIHLKSGGCVLLRLDELADKKPYIFCEKCIKASQCREGIFPVRLSADGELIPCMADVDHRIYVRDLLRDHDSEGMENAFRKIALWQNSNIQIKKGS